MKFPADIPIHSIISDIQKIQGLSDGGRDHGLFRAPVKATLTTTAIPGMWMERSRTLKYYQIKNNQAVEYKKKHRPMTIQVIDGSEHTFIVDDSQTVRKICDRLGEQLQLGKDGEQFCLCYAGSTIKKPIWLEESLTLHDQPDPDKPKRGASDPRAKDKKTSEKDKEKEKRSDTLTSEAILQKGPLLFWKRYYAHDSDISKMTNTFLLNIYFVQTLKQILSGMFPLGRVDAKNFGALQLQATKGNYKEGEAMLPPSEYLPPLYHSDKKLPVDVYNEWKRLNGAKEDTAKNRYIQLARSMKTYGMTFYDFTETKLDEVASKKTKKQKFTVTPVTLAVSNNKIAYYNAESNQFTKNIPYTSLRRYELLLNVLTLMIADSEGGTEMIQLESPNADEVYALIEGYIAIILREREDTQKVISDEDGSVAEMEDDGAVWFQSNAANTGRGFNNPNNITTFGGWGPSGPMMASPDENAMMSRVTNLEDAIKGMKGISDHLGSKKGAWGKKKTEAEWKKDLTSANVFIAPALADFLEECRLNDKGNRKMLDLFAKNMYAHALNMTQAAQQLAALNNDHAALLDGAKAVADSLAEIMALCSDEKNPPSEALLDACLKQHNIIMHLIKDPELLHHIDSGSEYLLMNCLYEIDNQANLLLSEAVKDPEKIAAAKVASQIKGLALSSLAALIPYAVSPQILSQIAVAEDMIVEAMAPLGLDMTKLKEAIALLGVGKMICEGNVIDGSIDVTTNAALLNNSLALIRAEMATGNTSNLYKELEAVQHHHKELDEDLKKLIPKTEEKLSNRLTKAEKIIANEMGELSVAANVLMTENVTTTRENSEEKKAQVLEKIGKLEEQSQLLVTDIGVLTTLNNLRHHSKQVAADMVRLKTVAEVAAENVPSKNKAALLHCAKDIATSLNTLFTQLQSARDAPNNLMTQQLLMQVVQRELPQWEALIKTSAEAVPLVSYTGTDELKKVQVPIVKQKLDAASLDAENSAKNLKRAVKRMGELEGNVLIAQALMELEMLKATVENAEVMAAQGQLPFDHRLDAMASALKVQKASEKFLQTSRALVTASADPDAQDQMPELIMNNVNALERLVATQHNLAGITSDKRLQTTILGISSHTVQDSINLIAVSRLVNDDISPKEVKLAKTAQKALLEHLVQLQSAYGESDYEEIKALKDDIERKKFKIAMGPLQSTTKTQPVIDEQSLLLARALQLTTNQLVDSVLYTPQHTRFPLSVYAGVAVDLLDQFTFHPKLTGPVKTIIGDFHEDVVKVIDAVQAIGKTRNQDNIDNLIKSSQAPMATLKLILDQLIGPTKVEINQSVLDLMTVLDDAQAERSTRAGLKPEILAEIQAKLNELGDSVQPLVPIHQFATNDPATLIAIAQKATKVASQIAVTAQASRGGQPMSLGAVQLSQACDLAAKNSANPEVLGTLKAATPGKINDLIAASKIALITEPDATKRQAGLVRLQEVVGASTPFLEACGKKDANRVASTAEDLSKKVLALQETLYTAPKDRSRPHPYIFTTQEARKLCDVSMALGLSTANLVQNAGIKQNESNSVFEFEDKQRKARDEFDNNFRLLSKLLTDREENQDLLHKAAEVVRLASYQLISAETAASFGQPLALPEDFDKERSTHAQDAFNSTLQCIVNLKNILDAYKSNDSGKLMSTIGSMKATMNTFAHQIVTTAAMISEADQQMDLLEPSVQFALTLLPLLKAIEVNDVNDAASFPVIVQAAQPVIATLKGLNAKLTDQRTNQNKIDKIIATINEVIEEKPGAGGPYEKNRSELIAAAHNTGLALAALVNAHNEPQHILDALDEVAQGATDFIRKAKETIATCDDASVKHNLEVLAQAIQQAVVKAVVNAKDEIIGINLHAQQLANFHNATADVDKLVNLLTSVEKVLLEGTATEILNSINALAKAKLMVENGELSKVDNYKEKAAVPLVQISPQVDNSGKKLGEVFVQLNSVSDMQLGTKANTLASNTKAFDEAILDTVFALKNKDDQVNLLDHAIAVTILASANLNPKLGSAGRQENGAKANQHIAACTAKINEISDKEKQAAARTQAQYKDTLNRLQQPIRASDVPKKESNPAALTAASQDLLGAVAKIVGAPDFEQSAQVAATLPDLMTALLSAELGLPDLEDGLKDDFLNASRTLQQMLADFLQAQEKARAQGNHEQLLQPNLNKIVEATGSVVALVKRLPQETGAVVDDGSAKDIEQQTEDELRKCARMIEDAVKLLASVQPGQKKSNATISTADVAEAILEAARAIGMSVSDLVQSAALVQSERKEAAATSSKYNVDPAWANGLVSAAQLVTENVRQLVTCANASAKGGADADEERLVAISKTVAAVTIQLLTASRTKAEDPTAPSQRQLTKAASAVQNATSQLVVAAQAAQEMKETAGEDDFSKLDFSSASGLRAQMEQMGKIEKLEKELRDTHQELIKLRRARYQNKASSY